MAPCHKNAHPNSAGGPHEIQEPCLVVRVQRDKVPLALHEELNHAVPVLYLVLVTVLVHQHPTLLKTRHRLRQGQHCLARRVLTGSRTHRHRALAGESGAPRPQEPVLLAPGQLDPGGLLAPEEAVVRDEVVVLERVLELFVARVHQAVLDLLHVREVQAVQLDLAPG
jgi:hypothetical protein